MDSKINAGYIITDEITVGESTFVLGVRPNAPSPYVTWQCKDDDYFWGHYFTDRFSAAKDLCQRATNEVMFLESTQPEVPNIQKKSKPKDFER